jgi:hypothetical protein
MSEFETFLKGLSLLKDCVVSQLIWAPEARTLRFEIADFYRSFAKLPQYPGAVGGAIELQKVTRVGFDLDSNENELIIFDFDVETVDGDLCLATITFWPDGIIRAWHRQACFPHLNSPGARS